MAKLDNLDMQQRALEESIEKETEYQKVLRRNIATETKSLEFMTWNAQTRQSRLMLARTTIDEVSAKYAALVSDAQGSENSYGSTCDVVAPADLDEQTDVVDGMQEEVG